MTGEVVVKGLDPSAYPDGSTVHFYAGPNFRLVAILMVMDGAFVKAPLPAADSSDPVIVLPPEPKPERARASYAQRPRPRSIRVPRFTRDRFGMFGKAGRVYHR